MSHSYYAVSEIVDILKLESRARVYQIIKDLEIEKVFIPGSRRFFVVSAEEVERMKQRNTEPGRPKKNMVP